MRSTFFALALVVFVTACANKHKADVWKQYEWLPEGAEYYNPYLIPPGAQRGYTNAPVMDNDSTYVQPRGNFGMCGSNGYLMGCE